MSHISKVVKKFRAVLGEDYSGSLVTNIDILMDRIAALEAERDNWRANAEATAEALLAAVENCRVMEAERDALEAECVVVRRRTHAAANRVVKRAIAERDDQRRRAEAAEERRDVFESMLGDLRDQADAIAEERDALKAEVARLRDDVEEVIALLDDTEHTDDYVARVSGKHLLEMALNPEELPFVDNTVSDHAPDVAHELSGINPLHLKGEGDD